MAATTTKKSAAKKASKSSGKTAGTSEKKAAEKKAVGASARKSTKKTAKKTTKKTTKKMAKDAVKKAAAKSSKRAATKAQNKKTPKKGAAERPGGGVSALDVNLGHIFALRPRIDHSFRRADFLVARQRLCDESYARLDEAARAVVEKALELTRGGSLARGPKRKRW